jgi:hypothetical protein
LVASTNEECCGRDVDLGARSFFARTYLVHAKKAPMPQAARMKHTNTVIPNVLQPPSCFFAGEGEGQSPGFAAARRSTLSSMTESYRELTAAVVVSAGTDGCGKAQKGVR